MTSLHRVGTVLIIAVTMGCGDSSSDLEARMAALEADNAALRAQLDTAVTAADLVGYALSADLAVVRARAEATLKVMDAATTWNVPADYPTLDAALDALDAYTLTRKASLRILIAPGTYAFTSAIEFAHPDGARVEITGGGAADAVVLSFPASSGVVVKSQLRLSGMTLTGGRVGFDYFGIHVSGGAMLGPQLNVNNFVDGIHVNNHAFVEAGGVIAEDNLVYGFFVGDNATLMTLGGGATMTARFNQIGFGVVNGGHANLFGATAHANADGLHCQASTCIAGYATITNNTGTGVSSTNGGYISAFNQTRANNGTNANPAPVFGAPGLIEE